MEENKINFTKDKDDSHSLLYSEETIEPAFYHSIMNQKINKKIDIILPHEITKKKKIIYDLFQKKFGPNFLEKKPESLNHFESLLGKYFFSSKSKFLKKYFPKIYDKIFKDKKVDLERLKSKINIGSTMYLTLRKNLVSNKSLINDKLLQISKNYSTKVEKDLVSNLYFKFKKNAAKKIRKKKISKKISEKNSSSRKSLNFGNISKVNSNELESIEEQNNNDKFREEIKIDLERNKNHNKFIHNSYNSYNFKTHNNFYCRNKNIVKFKTSLLKDKSKNKQNLKALSFKNFDKKVSSELNTDKYKKYYLQNPFYIYNSNIYNRNKNKYKTFNSDNTTSTNNFINPPQMTISHKNANIHLSNSSSKGNDYSLSSKNKTISSFKNVQFNINKPKEINNIKTISNEFQIKNQNKNKINIIEEKEKEFLNINEYNEDEIKENNESSINIQKSEASKSKAINYKRKYYNYIFKEKNSFDKFLKKKTKKVKNRINSEAKLLNNYTNKCNKKLIKLIDKNFTLNSKQKQHNQNKNVNFDITKLLLDDKIPKKVFINYAKNLNTIKPIVKKTVDDLTRFDKRNKILGQKYFIKHINDMPTELALHFIGELYQTNHIKFGLKEYERKREEEQSIKDEKILKKLRIKSKDHLFKMKQLEYILLNERDAFFHNENEKMKNKKIFNKIHGIDDIKLC